MSTHVNSITLRHADGERVVPVVAQSSDLDIPGVLAFPPFREWVARLQTQVAHPQVLPDPLVVHRITLQSIDKFHNNRIGFVKFSVEASFQNSKAKAPGIVFMRGGSICILLILKAKDSPPGASTQEWVVLTQQPRLAIADLAFTELPAGMLDGEGQFQGKAAQELYEETGLRVRDDELVDMTQLAFPAPSNTDSTHPTGVYLSPGGCDEFMRIFLCRKLLPQADIDALRGKLTGLRDQGEHISLKLCPLSDLWKATPDAKALAAWALYSNLHAEGRLPTD
ncbi:nudix hydrolase 14 [Dimargaris cristalligena]|uniref:Nudix hydrolase 14 n=1 Tax=Dimargaris cristalligena TaxID=215637 RepID=A0A4P9ZXA5_9FUNG|nr:nudix hydrolase 14 [Dimargaris cristalligena]|eukprot:RKP38283.1 nudix hydrolase 14 [Dimargaris cristalligena]